MEVNTDKILLLTDLVSDYSFTASLKLGKFKQASRFRCQNPFYVKIVLQVDFGTNQPEYIPVELIILHYDGQYVLTSFDREEYKIKVVKGDLRYIEEVMLDRCTDLDVEYQILELTVRWKVEYGFDLHDDVVYSDKNEIFKDNLTKEVHTLVDDSVIGYPAHLYDDMLVIHTRMVGFVNYVHCAVLLNPVNLKVFPILLSGFEHINEQNISKIIYPLKCCTVESLEYFEVNNIQDLYDSRDCMFLLQPDTENNRSKCEIIAFVIGRDMGTPVNGLNYYSSSENECLYVRMFLVRYGDDRIVRSWLKGINNITF
eukprot:NODE_215_length_14308_cov_0.330987.p5 type:complete len:313 gc:universal NODE_215_length_14308_cov_0.330987:12627-13565(+)